MFEIDLTFPFVPLLSYRLRACWSIGEVSVATSVRSTCQAAAFHVKPAAMVKAKTAERALICPHS